MDIYLDKVSADKKDTLYRLLQYSLFEESATDGNEMTDDAIFEYKWFDRYFTEPDRLAFFIREQNSNKLLGFAMINTYTEHALEVGSSSKAVSYVEILSGTGESFWGVGIDTDIITSSIKAFVSAVNNMLTAPEQADAK